VPIYWGWKIDSGLSIIKNVFLSEFALVFSQSVSFMHLQDIPAFVAVIYLNRQPDDVSHDELLVIISLNTTPTTFQWYLFLSSTILITIRPSLTLSFSSVWLSTSTLPVKYDMAENLKHAMRKCVNSFGTKKHFARTFSYVCYFPKIFLSPKS